MGFRLFVLPAKSEFSDALEVPEGKRGGCLRGAPTCRRSILSCPALRFSAAPPCAAPPFPAHGMSGFRNRQVHRSGCVLIRYTYVYKGLFVRSSEESSTTVVFCALEMFSEVPINQIVCKLRDLSYSTLAARSRSQESIVRHHRVAILDEFRAKYLAAHWQQSLQSVRRHFEQPPTEPDEARRRRDRAMSSCNIKSLSTSGVPKVIFLNDHCNHIQSKVLEQRIEKHDN